MPHPPAYYPLELRSLGVLIGLLLLLILPESWCGPEPVGLVTPLTLDLNRASPAELMALPGVGPRLAEEIVLARPFHSVDELKPLLGDRRWSRVRGFLLVSQPDLASPGQHGQHLAEEVPP